MCLHHLQSFTIYCWIHPPQRAFIRLCFWHISSISSQTFFLVLLTHLPCDLSCTSLHSLGYHLSFNFDRVSSVILDTWPIHCHFNVLVPELYTLDISYCYVMPRIQFFLLIWVHWTTYMQHSGFQCPSSASIRYCWQGTMIEYLFLQLKWHFGYENQMKSTLISYVFLVIRL